ncbi:hypothetical protein HBB16_00005, partial [Pseudonocardia sp. MCCB 268]|nr:hypothetical protein [Pseudonocardia cytotoxica]
NTSFRLRIAGLNRRLQTESTAPLAGTPGHRGTPVADARLVRRLKAQRLGRSSRRLA